jgi:DNA replication licensing factor MCM2
LIFDFLKTGTNGFPVFSTVISANYIEKLDIGSAGEISEEDMVEIRKMGRNERIGELIVESIAPSIYGCEGK